MMKESVSPFSLVMFIKNRPSNLVIKLFLVFWVVIAMGCQSNQGVELDLSSPEKSAEVIMTALQNDDVETFKKCLTSRIIKEVEENKDLVEEKGDFSKFLAIWKESLGLFSGPADFARAVEFSQENGQWKMDET
ncbi:hypothetical protein [Desulfobacter sp.]|uniref:hypothetical protein n=1 Tax=Desulfobacter sp. TaxID=2294 RepID=UPI002580CBDC|nr:hypothetical protein [Desulfobacter sp.]